MTAHDDRTERALDRMKADEEAKEAFDEKVADGTATVDDFRARLHPKPTQRTPR